MDELALSEPLKHAAADPHCWQCPTSMAFQPHQNHHADSHLKRASIAAETDVIGIRGWHIYFEKSETSCLIDAYVTTQNTVVTLSLCFLSLFSFLKEYP